MRVRETAQLRELIHLRGGGQLPERMLSLFSETGALLKGHFRLQSGLHSPYFARIGQLLYRPADAAEVASLMSSRLTKVRSHNQLVCLASDNSSGYLGRALATSLNAKIALAKIDAHRRPTRELADGHLCPGDNVLIVSDVVTTGHSLEPLLEIAKDHQAAPVGVSTLLVLSSTHYLSFLAKHNLPGEDLLEAAWEPVTAETCTQCASGEGLLPGFEFN